MADVARPELRVSPITNQQVEQARVKARGQALGILMARLPGKCVLRSGAFGSYGPFAALLLESEY